MRILFSKITLKHIFATFKILQLGHDLPTSVNDRVNSPICHGLIFMKFRKNKALAKISKFTVYLSSWNISGVRKSKY